MGTPVVMLFRRLAAEDLSPALSAAFGGAPP